MEKILERAKLKMKQVYKTTTNLIGDTAMALRNPFTFRQIHPGKKESDYSALDKIKLVFVDIKKTKEGRSTVVGTAFRLQIGMNVARTVGLNAGDKVNFYVDDEEPRIWFIRKSDTDTGYTLFSNKQKITENQIKKEPRMLVLAITWKEYTPESYQRSIYECDFEHHQGGLLIKTARGLGIEK